MKAREKFNQATEQISVRNREFLRVYRPMPNQQPIHECKAHELLIWGGKRAGKSVCAAAEFASRVLGIPIVREDGTKIPLKFPVSTHENPMTYWIIGLDMRHIGKTIYRLLFARGMRNSIRVLKKQDGTWRIYNPANPRDARRFKHSKLAEPAIPERFIEPGSFHYESLKAREFKMLRLTNGATIYAFPSTADNPGMGDAVDGIWINEDIAKPDHLSEWQDRLIDRDGWIIWDAFPQMQNHAIVDMKDRADAQINDPEPDICSFQLISSKNQFTKKEAKARGLRRMGDEDAIARRDRGELLRGQYLMYDYVPKEHLIKKNEECDVKTVRGLLEHIYTTQGRFPREWTRYLSIDPSHTRTAVLSGVVPPPEVNGIRMGRRVIIEWDIVVRKHSPQNLAKLLYDKMRGFEYELFIIDRNCGRSHMVGLGDRAVMEVYATAMGEYGLQCNQLGSAFMLGCNIPERRHRMVRELLLTTMDGVPTLTFCEQHTWETQREFFKYYKKTMKSNGMEVILDQPANPRVCDCMSALEYLCEYLNPRLEDGTAYIRAREMESEKLPDWVEKLIAETGPRKPTKGIHLGPGVVA